MPMMTWIEDPIVWIIVGLIAAWIVSELSKQRLKRATIAAQIAEQEAKKAVSEQTTRFADSDIHVSVAPEVSKDRATRDIKLEGGFTVNASETSESELFRREIRKLRDELAAEEKQPPSQHRDAQVTFLTKALADKEERYHERFGRRD
jgi:hypothetical protein